MSSPSLLIYIPTYNRGKNILTQLDQLERFVNGSPVYRPRFKVVIHDNCSPPSAEYTEAKRRCSEAGFAYVRNTVNLGANPNILHGFSFCEEADYLWICSDDELLRPDAIARIFACMENHPGIDAISLSQTKRDQDAVETVDSSKVLNELNIAGFGLISLVVYRTDWVKPYIRAGFDRLMSGFPHLAIFFEAVRESKSSKFLFVSAEDFFVPDGKCPPAEASSPV